MLLDFTNEYPLTRPGKPLDLISRLKRAETLLSIIRPDINLNDVPSLESVCDRYMHSDPPIEESLLESMVREAALLDINDQGYWDFHGHSSGLALLHRMRKQLERIMGLSENYASPCPRDEPLSQAYGSSQREIASPLNARPPNTHEGPSRDRARILWKHALDEACALMRFIHQPNFYVMLNRVYSDRPDNYGDEEDRFLTLLYAQWHWGCRSTDTPSSQLQITGVDGVIDKE